VEMGEREGSYWVLDCWHDNPSFGSLCNVGQTHAVASPQQNKGNGPQSLAKL